MLNPEWFYSLYDVTVAFDFKKEDIKPCLKTLFWLNPILNKAVRDPFIKSLGDPHLGRGPWFQKRWFRSMHQNIDHNLDALQCVVNCDKPLIFRWRWIRLYENMKALANLHSTFVAYFLRLNEVDPYRGSKYIGPEYHSVWFQACPSLLLAGWRKDVTCITSTRCRGSS